MQQRFKLHQQLWYIVTGRLPYDVSINPIVTMNHAVAHSDDLPPGNVWILCANLFGHATCRLPDKLQSTNDGVLELHITQETSLRLVLETGSNHSC